MEYINEESIYVNIPFLNEEVEYNFKCYDGHAIGTLAEDYSNAPKEIKMFYPTLFEVLEDEEKADYVLRYRGLYDLTHEDITYGDVMMALGELKLDEPKENNGTIIAEEKVETNKKKDTMLIKYECRKLAELLKGRMIEFDHKSYDDEQDIPHIFVNGQRLNVDSAKFSEKDTLVIYTSDDIYNKIVINLYNYQSADESFNEQLREINIDGLIRDMYYETNESYELGDFETDFLKVKCVYVVMGCFCDYLSSENNLFTHIFNTFENAKQFMSNAILDTADRFGLTDIDDYEDDRGNPMMQVTWDDGKSCHWEKIERKVLMD